MRLKKAINALLWLLFLTATGFAQNAENRGVVPGEQLSMGVELANHRFVALLIGIDHYLDPGFKHLETPTSDIMALKRLLKNRYGFDEVITLTDGQATHERIHQSFRDLIKDPEENQSILIYFAGHGLMDREINDGYWLPVDGVRDRWSTFINSARIQSYIRKMRARHVLLISDSCFSGALLTGYKNAVGEPNTRYYRERFNQKSRLVVTSGNLHPVSDKGMNGHSIFAYHVLRVLKENRQALITAEEIFQQIDHVVTRNSEQTPMWSPLENAGHEAGAFVFVNREVKPAVGTDPDRGNQKRDNRS